MIKTLSKYILASAAIAVVGCSDFLDKDNPAYDNVGFYKSEAGLKEARDRHLSEALFRHELVCPGMHRARPLHSLRT